MYLNYIARADLKCCPVINRFIEEIIVSWIKLLIISVFYFTVKREKEGTQRVSR